MGVSGGIKLSLTAGRRDDRRARFARVAVLRAGDQRDIELVTDASGRLAYPLAEGEYRLRVRSCPETEFTVGDAGWTVVRVSLS